MTGFGMITAIFALLLTATAGWAFGVATMNQLMPSPPTNVMATAGDGQATVSFNPSKSDGGSPIIRYTVTAHPGNITVSGKQSPITIKGLTNGITYTFTVTASNSVGARPGSESCNSVIPRAE